MKIDVVYEDKDLLVLDKPSGVVVNRAESVREETVQDWVDANLQFAIYNSQSNSNGNNGNGNIFKQRSGIVHRLDKETSGVLIVAKNPASFSNLQRQFKERKVKKEYIALAHGKIKATEGTIRAPVGRTAWDRKKFGVLPDGRESTTDYEVVAYRAKGKDQYTLLKLHPLTGRTHQIRVHLQYFGHPIVADQKYAGRKRYKIDRKWCPRLFLHAAGASFRQPTTGQEVEVKAELPKELNSLIGKLAA